MLFRIVCVRSNMNRYADAMVKRMETLAWLDVPELKPGQEENVTKPMC